MVRSGRWAGWGVGGAALAPPDVQLEQGQELFVRLAESDREPEVPGETYAGAVADQNTRLQESRAKRRGVGDGDEQEVRVRARKRVAPLRQLRAEKGPFLDHEPARALQVFLVLQCRQRRDLAEPVDIVGGADAIEAVDRLGARRRVPHAQSGQPGDLREGAEHDEPRVTGAPRYAIGVFGPVA